MSGLAVKYIPDPPAAFTPSADSKKESILLVDDLPANILVYQTILEELGQNLITVRSGEEALKRVLKQEFAVILLDVNMPTMNGFETAALIRQRKKSARTPIIFLTAFTDEVNMIQGYASGAVDYLPTPVVPEVLKAKVRVFIELSQMRRQAALQAEERVRREAAEESARTSAFLARVSESLTRSQSQADLLRTLVQLPMPHLADVSIVWFKEDEAAALSTEWSRSVSVGESSADELSDPPNLPWLERVMERVMATGRAEFLNNMPPIRSVNDTVQEFPRLNSVMVLPLPVQGRTRGALLLGRERAHPAYLPDDMPLAADLAYRAGVALENVMLVERIQEADRRKDEFLGMLAHELRNPLGPIYNAIQLLKMIGSKEPREVDLRDIIDRQTKHMGRLIDDLLDATRLAHGKILLRKERCDLTKIVCQTAEDYRRIFDVGRLTLNIQVPDDPIWINGDPTRLVQAVGNLLHNANKFTKPDGTISVRLEAEKENGMARVVVSDTGIGIEAKMLPWVFDTFRQAEQGLDRNRGGLGLGLALVKGLVELHNGDVRATSQGIDKGAEFTIWLPIEATQGATAPEAAMASLDQIEKYRILVIEDNRDAADSAQQLLKLEGHEVETAATAMLGLSAARNFRPQIVLCDIGLPEMDGYQFVRTIRKDSALSSAYIVALTGYGRDKDQQQALEAGFDLHLTKPIDYANLRRAISLAGAKVSA